MTLPEGLTYVPGFLTEAEERDVLAVLATFELQPYVLRDTPSRRLVRSFGLARAAGAYDVAPAAPIPAGLGWLRERCAALMGRQRGALAALLVTRYPPGAGSAGTGMRRSAARPAASCCRPRAGCGSPAAGPAPGRRPNSPSSPARPTSCPVRRGRNGRTRSLRVRRSGGR
jgi:hypothetical protein